MGVTTTVRQLAELVHGQVHGNADAPISAARPLSEAGDTDVTFIENEKHAYRLRKCRAAAVVVPDSLPVGGITVIRVADPLAAFVAIVRHLHGRAEAPRTGSIPAPSFIRPPPSAPMSACIPSSPSARERSSGREARSTLAARSAVTAGSVMTWSSIQMSSSTTAPCWATG